MTGHQEHPATGKTLKGESTHQLNLVEVAKSAGVNRIRVVDAYNLAECEKAIKEELQADEVSVIIAQRPCALLIKMQNNPFVIDADKCRKCGACLKIGCPAILKHENGKAEIRSELCVGCGLCKDLCKFDAIREVTKA